MANTLIASKPVLEQELKKLLYEAYLAQFLNMTDQSLANLNAEMIKNAHQMANKFAKAASKGAANAIYDFVKSIGITITPTGMMAPPAPSGYPPGGPATGTITSSNITII